MTAYEIYVFVLCFIVFSIFTVLFSVLITSLVRSYLRLVSLGAEDEKIKIEYEKEARKNKRASAVAGCISWIVTIAIVVATLVSFSVSLFVGAKNESQVGNVPELKVVKSSSMSYKNAKNSYLFENSLNDQIAMFDLIVLHCVPDENDIELYDIVAYERDGDLILHRIVGIEEPSDKHPEARYFLLQGDAVDYHDKFPVLYQDIRGIYEGEKIPFIGSFFAFMQSPAGLLCVILILFAVIITPIAENKIKKEKDARYALICPAVDNVDALPKEAGTDNADVNNDALPEEVSTDE
ncbi:MAG: hypothetical protein E7626_03205 [Ruminococcaceae bacterium]|nr:hypothetical protein [Oscillospiraceae bacterium]